MRKKTYKLKLFGRDYQMKVGEKAEVHLPIKVKSIDKENFKLHMVASTQDVDRHGDVLIQSGVELENFLLNPVILNSHRYGDIVDVIARAENTEVKGKGKKSRLEMDWIFAVKENPKAQIAFDLYAGKFLNASSVGLIPREFKKNQDGTTDWFTITKWELLETSAVSVPANARALAKQKGIKIEEYEEEEKEEEGDEEEEELEEYKEEEETEIDPDDEDFEENERGDEEEEENPNPEEKKPEEGEQGKEEPNPELNPQEEKGSEILENIYKQTKELVEEVKAKQVNDARSQNVNLINKITKELLLVKKII
jgi:hypothetical protein